MDRRKFFQGIASAIAGVATATYAPGLLKKATAESLVTPIARARTLGGNEGILEIALDAGAMGQWQLIPNKTWEWSDATKPPSKQAKDGDKCTEGVIVLPYMA